ncbi:hypothetical protein CCACVL1_25290 [Corchorus capsularis]|uniref:Uncharacterized protein n=1 Tax=Corchorus capsularis TaxID=210143 RepID=A0A1R3GLC2_COCAP|nr:hypothetical protein CCACVL1_25290 [Corchorus capsularis]
MKKAKKYDDEEIWQWQKYDIVAYNGRREEAENRPVDNRVTRVTSKSINLKEYD